MAKKKKPSLTISKTLDLHGLTIQKAYERTREFLVYCQEEEFRYVRVITGKSGQICIEFPTWIETWNYSIVETNVGNYIVNVI